MKIYNLLSTQGNPVPNQFRIIDDKGTHFFQSYNTIISKIENGKTFLDERNYKFSKTTRKYLSIFLNLSLKEIDKNIKENTFYLTNLN